MERKEFLKNGMAALGMGFIAPLLESCSNETISPTDPTIPGTTPNTGTCAVSPTETAGPYPTRTPNSLVNANIVSDRPGVPLTIKITINNYNCASLAGAIVDIWHCDAAGNYSEYGGNGMQSTNYSSVHFLRGRQTTDANGLVTFTSIFPGWYPGRAPHIHVHVFDASGTSLMITQIAFPTDVCNMVYTTAADYRSRGTQDRSNTADGIFSNSLANQLATVTGSIADGLHFNPITVRA